MYGANPEQLEQLARVFDTRSGLLLQAERQLSARLRAASWRAPDRRAFESQWPSAHARQLASVAGALRTPSKTLVDNAREQRQTSAGACAGDGGSGSGGGLEAAGEGLARERARNLTGFVGSLGDMGVPAERITVVAHRYGTTVVTGLALADGLDVGRAVVVGSAGLGGVDDFGDLDTDVDVWADRTNDDLVPEAPFHGEEPTARGFDARRFDPGPGGHSDSFKPGRLLKQVATLVIDGEVHR